MFLQMARDNLFRYIFKLKPGRYVVVISAAPKVFIRLKPIKFVLRAVGDNIAMQHLEYVFFGDIFYTKIFAIFYTKL